MPKSSSQRSSTPVSSERHTYANSRADLLQWGSNILEGYEAEYPLYINSTAQNIPYVQRAISQYFIDKVKKGEINEGSTITFATQNNKNGFLITNSNGQAPLFYESNLASDVSARVMQSLAKSLQNRDIPSITQYNKEKDKRWEQSAAVNKTVQEYFLEGEEHFKDIAFHHHRSNGMPKKAFLELLGQNYTKLSPNGKNTYDLMTKNNEIENTITNLRNSPNMLRTGNNNVPSRQDEQTLPSEQRMTVVADDNYSDNNDSYFDLGEITQTLNNNPKLQNKLTQALWEPYKSYMKEKHNMLLEDDLDGVRLESFIQNNHNDMMEAMAKMNTSDAINSRKDLSESVKKTLINLIGEDQGKQIAVANQAASLRQGNANYADGLRSTMEQFQKIANQDLINISKLDHNQIAELMKELPTLRKQIDAADRAINDKTPERSKQIAITAILAIIPVIGWALLLFHIPFNLVPAITDRHKEKRTKRNLEQRKKDNESAIETYRDTTIERNAQRTTSTADIASAVHKTMSDTILDVCRDVNERTNRNIDTQFQGIGTTKEATDNMSKVVTDLSLQLRGNLGSANKTASTGRNNFRNNAQRKL